jgi:nitric oxide reductase activation protein
MFTESLPVAGSGGMGDRDPRGFGEDDHPDLYLEQQRQGIPYDEWDEIRGVYHRGFATVFEHTTRQHGRSSAVAQPALAEVIRRSARRDWFDRLPDGTDVDVDAIAQSHVAELSGVPHDGRVYRSLGQGRRDVASALVLDASLSLRATAGWTMGLQLECARALSIAMTELREPHAVYAFSSEGRHHVGVRVLRSFDDDAPLAVQPGDLRPSGYTRLGSALRHATARLLDHPAERRVLLAMGDGMPSDEGYEGRYAVADVAKALEEAAEAGISALYVGLGDVRRDPLARALGDHMLRVKSLEDLYPALAHLHEELRS